MEKEPGQIGYEAYLRETGGISLATGSKLPPWGELNEQVQSAWRAADKAIRADALALTLPISPRPQKPSIGRIVILHTSGPDIPAIVRSVSDDDPMIVDITAFGIDANPLRVVGVSYGSRPGRWSWPERA